MYSKFITKTRKKVNEDFFVTNNKNIFILCDGATSLSKKRLFPNLESDTFWIRKYIENNIELADKPFLFIEKINKLMIRDFPKKKIKPYQVPSMGIVYAFILDEKITFVSLGDCAAIIETKFSTEVFLNSPLEELDDIVNNDMIKKTQKNENCFNNRSNKIIKKNRSLLNKLNGYGVLAPLEIPKKFINIKTYNLKDIKSFALMSDGGYRFIKPLELGDKNMMISLLKKGKISEIVKSIFEREDEDKLGTKYHRISYTDDVSIFFIDFEK